MFVQNISILCFTTIFLPLPLSLEELELEELPELEEFEELRLEPLDEPLDELEPDLELDDEPLQIFKEKRNTNILYIFIFFSSDKKSKTFLTLILF